MRKTFLGIIASLALALSVTAQTNNPTPGSLAEDFLSGLSQATNYAVVAYGEVQPSTDKWGAGGMILYTPPTTEWLGVGLGMDYFDKTVTVVSGSATLKKTFKVGPIGVTPFGLAGIGIPLGGTDGVSPAVIAGAGVALDVFKWDTGKLGLYYSSVNWQNTGENNGWRQVFGLAASFRF